MNWLPKVVAILIVVDGIVVLLKPDWLKKYFEILQQGAAIYLDAVIKASVGIIFLLGLSGKGKLPAVPVVFGILALADAIFNLVLPTKAVAIARWFAARNELFLRMAASVYLIIGALLVYST